MVPFDDAYLSKIVEDKQSWFTRNEVLDLIYDQLFFTANNLGRQPMTSQYVQHHVPQTIALAAAPIHCALSEYASGMKATVRFSQDEYQGTFSAAPMINFTPEATALINHSLFGHFRPPPRTMQHIAAWIGTPQSLLALLSLDSLSSISFRSPFLLFRRFSAGMGTPSSPLS